MKPHYNPDNQSAAMRVFIPIQEWNAFKSDPVTTNKESFQIPDWQKEIVLSRIEAYENGSDDFLDFEDAMKEIEKDL